MQRLTALKHVDLYQSGCLQKYSVILYHLTVRKLVLLSTYRVLSRVMKSLTHCLIDDTVSIYLLRVSIGPP